MATPPESIREFCERVGVAKRNNVIDVGLLEFALRDHLNATALRAMAVLRPIKMVVVNYPAGDIEWMPTVNNPEDESAGSRELPFGRELFIESEDFKVEGVNKKWFRLAPGRSVRLKSAYIVTYVDHVTDANGEVTEVHVEYHPESKSGSDTSGIKAKGTLHWVECSHAKDAEVRLYDRLFLDPNPDGQKDKDFMDHVNPDSLHILEGCKVEPALAEAVPGATWQFTRLGYFAPDAKLSSREGLVFNRAVTLKDGWKGKG